VVVGIARAVLADETMDGGAPSETASSSRELDEIEIGIAPVKGGQTLGNRVLDGGNRIRRSAHT